MQMPWQDTDKNDEKLNFIVDWKKNEFSFSELCKRYQISRPTGYALVNRFQREGVEGLKEKSKAPLSTPHKIAEEVESFLLQLKYRFPKWGPAKIKDFLMVEGIEGDWPASSTIGEVYKRHGLVRPRKKRKRIVAHSAPLKHCSHPNAVWSADFKGHFKLKNKRYCYPLTITDNFSRFLFACDAFESPNCENTIKTFKRVFLEYGLPDTIRTDNGQPFCSFGVAGLTRLSIWFLKLGITPERITMGAPQENGRHERMHRTLKEAVIIPEKNTLCEQQAKFDAFIEEYNTLRPHSALKGLRPNEVYTKSLRQFPEKLTELVYPDEFSLRKVKCNGEIKFAGKRYFVSELLHGETLGLERVDDHRAIVYFSKLKLGMIDSKSKKIIKPYSD
jgi:transposase InsO family protein